MTGTIEDITNNTRLTPLSERQTKWLNEYKLAQPRSSRIGQIELYCAETIRLGKLRQVYSARMKQYIEECAKPKTMQTEPYVTSAQQLSF